MAKSLSINVLLFLVVDLFFNIIINLVQGNPGSLIMITMIVRIISFGILISLIGLIVLHLLKQQSLLFCWTIIFVIVYFIIPIILFFLKEDDNGVWQVYIDLHFKPELFIVVFLPYLLACIMSLFVFSRIKEHS